MTSSWGGRRSPPFAFTEQCVAMLSSVLNSEKAVQVNIAIMRAFVQLRKFLQSNESLANKLKELKKKRKKDLKNNKSRCARSLPRRWLEPRRPGFANGSI